MYSVKHKAATLALASVITQLFDQAAAGEDDEAHAQVLYHLRRLQGDPSYDDGADVPTGAEQLEATSIMYGIARALQVWFDEWIHAQYAPPLPHGVDHAIDFLLDSYELPQGQRGPAAIELRRVLEAHG